MCESVEYEETTIEAEMLATIVDLAKQVGRLEAENDILSGDFDDEEETETIIDCASMSLNDLVELDFTDEQLLDIIRETRAEINERAIYSE